MDELIKELERNQQNKLNTISNQNEEMKKLLELKRQRHLIEEAERLRRQQTSLDLKYEQNLNKYKSDLMKRSVDVDQRTKHYVDYKVNKGDYDKMDQFQYSIYNHPFKHLNNSHDPNSRYPNNEVQPNPNRLSFYNSINPIETKEEKQKENKIDEIDYDRYKLNNLDYYDNRYPIDTSYNHRTSNMNFNNDYSRPYANEEARTNGDKANEDSKAKLNNEQNSGNQSKYNQREFLYPKHSKVYMEEVDKLENICKKKQMDYKAINRIYLDYNKDQILNKAKNKELVEELRKRSIEDRIKEVSHLK